MVTYEYIPLGDVVADVLSDGGRVVADDETCTMPN